MTRPSTLQIADMLDAAADQYLLVDNRSPARVAAVELRRLYQENLKLRDAVEKTVEAIYEGVSFDHIDNYILPELQKALTE